MVEKVNLMSTNPTIEQFSTLEKMYETLNKELFNGQLPACVLLLARRKKREAAFFAPNTWRGQEDKQYKISEITLTHQRLGEPPMVLFSDLLHEMCHLWQHVYGKPSRGGYHNREWADKMISVGLQPSDTGAPGGKETGQSMDDYVIEGGRYERLMKSMEDSGQLPYITLEAEISRIQRGLESDIELTEDQEARLAVAAQKNRSKTPYICPSCDTKVWGKPSLHIMCGTCDEAFQEEE